MMIQAYTGHIINISSLAGKNALPNGAAYAASKWGLNGLSYSVAEELRSHNIRVSVVCPGSVETELSPHAGKDPKKMLQPEDVAHAVPCWSRRRPIVSSARSCSVPRRSPDLSPCARPFVYEVASNSLRTLRQFHILVYCVKAFIERVSAVK